MSHTLGPWHPGHLGSDSPCQCKSVVAEGYLGAVCTVHVDNGLSVGEGGNDAPPRDEAVANMHLIAAAPEILAALKEAKEYLESIARNHHRDWKPEMVDDDSLLGAIYAAISKAEGRQ